MLKISAGKDIKNSGTLKILTKFYKTKKISVLMNFSHPSPIGSSIDIML